MSRDNWERLVAAVLKREQFWQLCHQDSRSPSNVSTISSDDFSAQFLNFSSNSLEPVSVSPHPPAPPVYKASNNASGPVKWKLFSAWYRRRENKEKHLVDIPEDLGIHSGHIRRFSLHELKFATQNFSNKNLLEYGYNKVYKGRLADGSVVAVKRHKSRHAHDAEVQFRNQVDINSIAEHPNVLHVLGLCITPKEWLLVYPLMVNGSVASCLRGRHKLVHPLNWPIRKRIALGSARGLAYLHYECEKKIIHRDIKAANILLDDDFEAVVADFELALIMDYNVTHVNTSIVGTIGHLAPECLSSGMCSEKTDVFGYGIFLLELITGQRAFDLGRLASDDDVMLRDWVIRNCKERKWEMMVDANYGGNFKEEVVEQLLQIALLCTQSIPDGRPTMSEVVRMLEVGDGLAESREEYSKVVNLRVENTSMGCDRIIAYGYDDAIDLVSEQLSGPR